MCACNVCACTRVRAQIKRKKKAVIVKRNKYTTKKIAQLTSYQ